MSRSNKESGQALVFGVATLGILLIGIAGLGIDMGYLRYQKRLLQAAADSAAIAAASDLPTAFGGVTLAAQNAAAANGYTVASVNLATCPPPAPATAVGSISLTVNNGPCSGPHNGLSDYVEVYLSQVQPTFFMKILGTASETITARAVATALSGGANSGCLYTLGPPAKGIGVNINGSVDIEAPTCGIVDNGNFLPGGNAYTLHAGSISVADPGCIGSGCGKGDVTCGPSQAASNCPAYSSPPGPNPEAALTPPTQPAASSSCPGPVKGKAVACDVSTSGTTTLQPGTYSSIDFGKNSTTTLASGIYYINGGGLTFEGNATVNDVGNGVMFYLTCAPGTSPCSNGATLNAVGGGNVPDIQLTSPSPTNCPSCPSQYDGMLFYQDPNDTNAPSLGGDDNTTLNGILYFPSVQLTFFGNNHFTAGIVIADSISFSGNPTVTLSGTAGLPSGVSFVTSAVLVE